MQRSLRDAFLLLCALAALSCGDDGADVTSSDGAAATGTAPPIAEVPAIDREVIDDHKGDRVRFDPDLIIDDDVFEDHGALSAAELETFFVSPPYDAPSFLSAYVEDGRSAAQILADAAVAHRINPIVLLAKLQVEMGLVSRTTSPGGRRLAHAMGCACPDNAPCSERHAGFATQVDCAARVFRWYLDDLDSRGATISGWQVGVAKRSLDPQSVTPGNRATAALYTYTPWVLVDRGGNWLFWNIYRRYARHIAESNPNRRWIGGACSSDEGCAYGGGLCHPEVAGGTCTLECARYCPDSTAPQTSTTFCADLGGLLGGATAGGCLARCDDGLFPQSDGCRPGLTCRDLPRFGEPEITARACAP